MGDAFSMSYWPWNGWKDDYRNITTQSSSSNSGRDPIGERAHSRNALEANEGRRARCQPPLADVLMQGCPMPCDPASTNPGQHSANLDPPTLKCILSVRTYSFTLSILCSEIKASLLTSMTPSLFSCAL